jgi:hypothetical protein
MDLEVLGRFKEHEGQPLIQAKKSPIHVEQRGDDPVP